MATIVEHVEVPVSTTAAFEYVADFTHTAHWDPMIRSARRIGSDPIGLGSAFAVDLALGSGGRTIPMVYVITRHEPPSHVVLETKGWWYRGRDVIFLTPGSTPASTMLRWEATFALRGPLFLLDPLLKRGFTKVAAAAVAGLVRALSSLGEATTPPEV